MGAILDILLILAFMTALPAQVYSQTGCTGNIGFANGETNFVGSPSGGVLFENLPETITWTLRRATATVTLPITHQFKVVE